jgi:hypothetical protein
MSILAIYRSVGVYKFYNHNDNSIIFRYIDGINSTILISGLASKFPIIKENYMISILLGLVLKYRFETFHHSIAYK